jgi:hypothetical protein
MGGRSHEGGAEMTYDEAIELVKQWPADRSVPRKLAKGILKATDEDAFFMGQLIEVLSVAASTPGEMALIEKYF